MCRGILGRILVCCRGEKCLIRSRKVFPAIARRDLISVVLSILFILTVSYYYPDNLPNALYTISKNVLGKNVTEKIAPFVRQALPQVIPGSKLTDRNDSGARSCTTPEGKPGTCEDLSNCPQLLLNLGNLRQSLCFKSLFVPGVCCPELGVGFNELPAPVTTVLTTSRPILALPVTTRKPVTAPAVYRPPPPTRYTTARPITTTRLSVVSTQLATVSNTSAFMNYTNYVNPEECGEPEWSSGRVVGGSEAASGAWPWMAAVFLSGPTRTASRPAYSNSRALHQRF